MKKIKKLCNWRMIPTLLLLIVVLFIGVSKLLGFELYAISSGSMAPAMCKGSLAFVKVDPIKDIQVDDIVVFQNYKVSIDSFSHRIVKIDESKQEFITKGDANETADPYPTAFDTYKGKVYFSIPLIGYVRLLLNDYSFLFVVFGIILIGCFLYEFGGERDEKNNREH